MYSSRLSLFELAGGGVSWFFDAPGVTGVTCAISNGPIHVAASKAATHRTQNTVPLPCRSMPIETPGSDVTSSRSRSAIGTGETNILTRNHVGRPICNRRFPVGRCGNSRSPPSPAAHTSPQPPPPFCHPSTALGMIKSELGSARKSGLGSARKIRSRPTSPPPPPPYLPEEPPCGRTINPQAQTGTNPTSDWHARHHSRLASTSSYVL